MGLRLGGLRWSRSLLVWSLIAATLGAVGMAVYTYRGYQRAATDLVIQRDGQVALLSAARLAGELDEFANTLSSLARTPDIVDGNSAVRQAALTDAALRMVVFDGGVVLLDNHGMVAGSIPERPDIFGRDWANRETYRQVLLKSDSFFSDASNDGFRNTRVVSIGVPILGPNQEFRGALVGMFNLTESARSSLYASIVRLRLGQSGSLIVTDGTNLVIYSASPEQVGEVYRPPDLPAVPSAPGAGAGRRQNEDGVDVVSAFAPVPSTNWTLTTEDNWNTITASTQRYRNLFLASLVVAGLLPAIGAAVLGRQGRFNLGHLDNLGGEQGVMHAISSHVSPRHMPMLPGWTAAQRHRLTTGGQRDFWDMAILKDGRLMLALARVEPVGVDAAVALTATRALWRDAVGQLSEPSTALEHANRVLCSGFSTSLHVRCTYILVDPTSGTFSYALAGQGPPFVAGPTTHVAPAHVARGLGYTLESTYATGQGTLPPGSSLVLVSQPMREARSQDKRGFESERLRALLENPQVGAENLAESLVTEFIDFTRRSPYAPPEISILVLERLPAETS